MTHDGGRCVLCGGNHPRAKCPWDKQQQLRGDPIVNRRPQNLRQRVHEPVGLPSPPQTSL